MNSKEMIGGLLAGAAIGIAVGILLAPASGKTTIEKLMKGSRKLTDDLQGNAAESIDALKDRYNSGVEHVSKKGKEMINQGNDRVKI